MLNVDLPQGRWVLAVSGHADSVALLRLAHERRHCHDLVVVHIDHETRAGRSAADARFVTDLCHQLGIACVVFRLSDLPASAAANKAARYRAARHEAYQMTVRQHRAHGVLLAHHADDQAETVGLRLLRGVVPPAHLGMQGDAQLPGGTRALRPLLHLHKWQLTEYLSAIGQQHHTDQSNDDLDQMRNGIRALLAAQPELTQLLLKLHAASESFRQMLLAATPEIRQPVTACLVADAPDLVARATSHRLLTAAGSPADELSRQVLQRLVTMCRDAATPPRQEFPGGIMVRRTKGQIITG